MLRFHRFNCTVLPADYGSVTAVILRHNIYHPGIFQYGNIRTLAGNCKQLACNFFSCNILMKKDTLVRMYHDSGEP